MDESRCIFDAEVEGGTLIYAIRGEKCPGRALVLEGAKDARGQSDDGGHELEDAADGDAEEAEGEQEQPDQGIEDECEQSEGPAKDEEKTPE